MGWKRTLKMHHPRRIVRRAIDAIRPGIIRLPDQNKLPDWINPTFKEFFTNRTRLNPGFERHGTLLSMEASNDLARTFSNTNRHQIELRNPYRDRRLIEFVLAIPAYQLYSHGMFKHILRIAMRGVLPEIIRTRHGSTSFVALYHRSVEQEQEL
jgi:asparagine synthetase B (glutamine-hydrolysing)